MARAGCIDVSRHVSRSGLPQWRSEQPAAGRHQDDLDAFLCVGLDGDEANLGLGIGCGSLTCRLVPPSIGRILQHWMRPKIVWIPGMLESGGLCQSTNRRHGGSRALLLAVPALTWPFMLIVPRIPGWYSALAASDWLTASSAVCSTRTCRSASVTPSHRCERRPSRGALVGDGQRHAFSTALSIARQSSRPILRRGCARAAARGRITCAISVRSEGQRQTVKSRRARGAATHVGFSKGFAVPRSAPGGAEAVSSSGSVIPARPSRLLICTVAMYIRSRRRC